MTVTLVFIISLYAHPIGYAARDGEPTCNDLEVDPTNWQFCENQPNENCASVANQTTCSGAQKWDRYEVFPSCRSAEDSFCSSYEVPCKTQWQCKWVSGPGQPPHCANDFVLIGPVNTSGKDNSLCTPSGG